MDPNTYTQDREATRSSFPESEARYRGPILSRTDRAVIGAAIAFIVFAVLFFSLGWAIGRNQLLERTFLPHAADTTTDTTTTVR